MGFGLFLAMVASLTVSHAADTIVPPATIHALLAPDKCLRNDPPSTAGPRRLCYPHADNLPELSPRQEAHYRERAQKLLDEGIPLWEIPRYLGKLLNIAVLKCESEFASELLDNGLNSEQISFAWADAVVFAKTLNGAPVREPTIVFNAEPGSVSGGIIVVLPSYQWCTEKKRAIADLKAIHVQWTRLQRLADANPDEQTALARAFDNPASIFKTVELSNGCPDVVEIARSDVRKPVPTATPANPRTVLRDKNRGLMARAMGPGVSEYAQKGIESVLANQRALMENQLKDLAAKGFEITHDRLSLKGTRITFNDIMGDTGNGFFGPTEKLEKLAKENGVSMYDIMNANMLQGQAATAYLAEYRKEHPLDAKKTYLYDPSGSGEIITVELAMGCMWNDTAQNVVCEGNFPGGGFPGLGVASGLGMTPGGQANPPPPETSF